MFGIIICFLIICAIIAPFTSDKEESNDISNNNDLKYPKSIWENPSMRREAGIFSGLIAERCCETCKHYYLYRCEMDNEPVDPWDTCLFHERAHIDE